VTNPIRGVEKQFRLVGELCAETSSTQSRRRRKAPFTLKASIQTGGLSRNDKRKRETLEKEKKNMRRHEKCMEEKARGGWTNGGSFYP